MESPLSLDADAVRDEKLKVLRALKPIPAHEVPLRTVRGQYVAGAVNGQPVPGYVAEPRRGPDEPDRDLRGVEARADDPALGRVRSTCAPGRASAAAKGLRDRGAVPLLAVQHLLDEFAREPNRLVIRLQPQEGIKLEVMTKEPGPGGMRPAGDRASTSRSRRPSTSAIRMPTSAC